MKVRTISLCISTALFISFSSSTVFADVNPVSDRGDLIESDTIFWDVQGTILDTGVDFYGYLNGSITTPNVTATNGTLLAVSQTRDPDFEIYREPATYYFRDANFADGDYLLSTFAFTNGNNNSQNPVTFVFSDTNAESICGFGTQIAPRDLGEFTAEIQAFDGNGAMGLPSAVTASTGDANAAFIGLSSTTAITSVEVVISNAGSGGGSVASWYVINQVTLTYCSDLPVEPPVDPEIPALTCEGFAAPMANHPVKTKKNRVFPLKMELFGEGGLEQTDADLIAAPVVKVEFFASTDGVAVDVSNDLLAAGHGTDGNQFEFTDNDIWQYNLKSNNYTAPGTYKVTVVSGDESEYVIDPNCETSFIKQ
ncbi:MAG: hypothetical protein WBS20_12455 [Lysobacterales bacterium]